MWHAIPTRGLLLVASCAALASRVTAQTPDDVEQVVQELFIAETAYLQDRGQLQVNLLVDARDEREREVGRMRLELEYGVTSWLQLGAGVPLGAVWDADGRVVGVGRPTAEVLLGSAVPGTPELVWSGGVEVSVPSVTEDVDDTSYRVAPNLRLQLGLLPVRIALRLAALLEQPVHQGSGRYTASGALGVFVPIGPVVPTLELRADVGDQPLVLAGAGVVWPVTDAIELGVAGYGGANEDGALYGGQMLAVFELDLLAARG